MKRAEWLKQMRDKVEALYDHLSPGYWTKFGLYANETHREYLQKFLALVPPRSTLLSAACGAGRYDGMLLEVGHSVLGIDQSAGMLARALVSVQRTGNWTVAKEHGVERDSSQILSGCANLLSC